MYDICETLPLKTWFEILIIVFAHYVFMTKYKTDNIMQLQRLESKDT